MPKNLLFLLIILFCFSTVAKADEKFGAIGKYCIEADYQFGRIIPHNKKFKPPVSDFSHSVEIGFYKQTLGDKAWQRKLNYPELGASFTFTYNGDQKIFGNAYILLMHAKFWIVRSKYLDFFVRPSSGIAFVPTHYNPVTNPINNAIGSTLNASFELRLGIDIKPDPQLQVMWALALTHYSNAATQLPNLGVNAPALIMGIRYFPKVSEDLKYNREKIPKPEKHDEVMVRLSIGSREIQAAGGPKYPVYGVTFNYARYTSITNKFLAGMVFEYDASVHDYYSIQEIETPYAKKLVGFQTGIFVGDEILIGKVGLLFAAGHYLFPVPKKFEPFVRLGIDYYFASVGKKKDPKFFIGVGMKSIYLVAQAYEVSTGIAF